MDKMTSEEISDQIGIDLAKGIGASEIGAILGMNKYTTPMQVYLNKTSGQRFVGNKYTEAGHMLEESIIKWTMIRENLVPYDLALPDNNLIFVEDRPFLRCHPDAIGQGGDDEIVIIECKTTQKSVEKYDDLSAAWLYQVQYQMGIARLCGIITNKAYIGVLSRGVDFHVFEVDFNQAAFDLCVEKATEFWMEHVIAGVAPPPVTAKDVETLVGTATLSAAVNFESKEGAMIALTEYKILKRKEKEIKAEIEELRDELAVYMMDNEIAIDSMGATLCTYKNQMRTSLDSKRLKEDRPEIVAEYSKRTTHRVLRIK